MNDDRSLEDWARLILKDADPEIMREIAGNHSQTNNFQYLNDLIKPYPDNFINQEWCTQEMANYLKEHWSEVKNELAEELGIVFEGALAGACDTVLRKGGLLK